MAEIDFGDGTIEVNALNPSSNPESVTDLDGKGDTVDINEPDPADVDNKPEGGDNQPDSKGGDNEELALEEGSIIEFDDKTYKVDASGNIVDEAGNIFKEAKDAAAWIKENQGDDVSDDDITIESLSKDLGVNIVDENGKPVVFSNDKAGMTAFINSVVNVKAREIQEGTLNNYFRENPAVKAFVDYTIANGGDYSGFGKLQDRSTITIAEDDAEQQKAIIKVAAVEFGIKGMDDNYIKYLEDNGSLYDTAKEQLKNLATKDAETKAAIAAKAEAIKNQQIQESTEYYAKVKAAIDSKKIGKYTLPDTFTKNVNGKTIVLTPKDFYKFVSTPDQKTEDGTLVTGYVKALQEVSPEELMNSELLDAWLKFTGGNYSSLVDMIAKEEKVKTLRITSAQKRTNKIVLGKSSTSSSKKGDRSNLLFE